MSSKLSEGKREGEGERKQDKSWFTSLPNHLLQSHNSVQPVNIFEHGAQSVDMCGRFFQILSQMHSRYCRLTLILNWWCQYWNMKKQSKLTEILEKNIKQKSNSL